MEKAYGVDFYAGDEDNGEMGAWFVLSALGLYVTTPGSVDYVFGSPIFKHVKILQRLISGTGTASTGVGADSSSGKSGEVERFLEIKAPGTKQGIYKVNKVYMNKNEITEPTITHNVLNCNPRSDAKSCVLYFMMDGDTSDINSDGDTTSGTNSKLDKNVIHLRTKAAAEGTTTEIAGVIDKSEKSKSTAASNGDSEYVKQLKSALKNSQGK